MEVATAEGFGLVLLLGTGAMLFSPLLGLLTLS